MSDVEEGQESSAGVEETQETESTKKAPSGNTNDSINQSLDDIDDPVVLKQMVKSLRGENAKGRKEKQQVKSELEEFNSWKASQMSDLERERDRADKAEQKAKDMTARAVLKEYNLDDDFLDFITGADEDEMREKAERLSGKLSNSSPTDDPASAMRPQGVQSTGLLAGKRGDPVGKAGKKSEGDWFGEFYEQSFR